jgi:putative ATP-binding cassette transporter
LLTAAAGEYKNAEYRIAVDVRLATDAPVDMALGLITAALTAAVFIDVLWNVGGSFPIAVGGRQITIPGYLVIGVCIYSALFTTVMIAIGHGLPAIVQLETQAEAEFLAAANDIRGMGDGSGAKDGETEKQRAVWQTLRQVILRWRQLCWQLMGTTMVSQTDLLLAPVCAWVLCGPKYLSGMMTLGELTQGAADFVAVQAAFNWLVDNYPRMSDWLSAAYRVANLLLALDAVTLNQATNLDAELPPPAREAS